MAFRFKQFTVEDDRSTMRVGTDALLLGALVNPGNAENILEIGTGSGVISLMIAQKTNTRITAIDIHEESVRQAEENFISSPWKNNLTALNISLQKFTDLAMTSFDLIITNPPFFRASLLPTDSGKILSKHDRHLTLEEIISSSVKLLSPEGKLAIILPPAESILLEEIAKKSGLFPVKKLQILPGKEKKPVRIILEIQKGVAENTFVEELIIRNADGSFTPHYLQLTSDYHCFDSL